MNESINAIEFGNRLMSLMKARGMTQRQLSEVTGLTEAAISRYISGKRTPRALTIGIIANALNVTSDELIGMSSQERNTLNDAIDLVQRSAKQIPLNEKKRLISELVKYLDNTEGD